MKWDRKREMTSERKWRNFRNCTICPVSHQEQREKQTSELAEQAAEDKQGRRNFSSGRKTHFLVLKFNLFRFKKKKNNSFVSPKTDICGLQTSFRCLPQLIQAKQ